MYVFKYVCQYIYIYMYVYIYICVCVTVCVYIYTTYSSVIYHDTEKRGRSGNGTALEARGRSTTSSVVVI